jgi:hypothetical protein
MSIKNLRLNYRYRDTDNYKQFGSVFFLNQSRINLGEAIQLLRAKLISDEFFVPQDWDLPSLHYFRYDPEIDHDYQEVEGFERTEALASDARDLLTFLQKIVKGYEVCIPC